jgi:hypothetical protein
MASEYLGWTQRQPSSHSRSEFDPSRVDRNVLPGGPVTQGYENLVKNIFRPNENSCSNNTLNGPVPSASSLQNAGNSAFMNGILAAAGQPTKISASAMLKMEEQLGKSALDDTMDDEALDGSLDAIYEELGINPSAMHYSSSTAYRPSSQYPVYAPKSSREYREIRDSVSNYNILRLPSNYRTTFRSYKDSPHYKERAEEEWKKNNRQTLVDYKDFGSSPLSPYMYQHHPYMHSQDSRIVGSNFVQLTTRPKDRFLEKIEQTLADVRASPRYSHY